MNDYLLLSACLQDPKMWRMFSPVLKSHPWDDDWVGWVYSKAAERLGSRNLKVQTAEDLFYLIDNDKLKDAQRETFWGVCEHLYSLEINDLSRDRLQDFMLDCKRSELSESLLSGKDLAEIESEIAKLKKIKSDPGFAWDNIFSRDALENPREVIRAEEGEPITTGLPSLDKIMNGGWYRGRQAIIVAKPGFGKTYLMISFAKAAVMAGKRVLYVALDNAKGEMRKRFYHCFSGIPFTNDLSDEEFSRRLLDMGVNENNFSLLVGHRKQTTMAEIDAMTIEKADEWGGYDMRIIDYIDVARFPKHEQNWQETEDAYASNAGFATKFNSVEMTASQPKVEGYGAKNIDLEHYAGSIGKGRHCGYSMAIKQNGQDRACDRAWLCVIKAREEMNRYQKPFTMKRSTGEVLDLDEPVVWLDMEQGKKQREGHVKQTMAQRLREKGLHLRVKREEKESE